MARKRAKYRVHLIWWESSMVRYPFQTLKIQTLLIQIVSSIYWLENDLFLLAHTPSISEEGVVPATTYHLASRKAGTSEYTFQKMPEVCSPFGLNRSPSFQFIQRLRNFPPDLQDVVI